MHHPAPACAYLRASENLVADGQKAEFNDCFGSKGLTGVKKGPKFHMTE